MREKSLKDISWWVTEEEYRADAALSYSTLASYKRGGFSCISQLAEKKESPALTFGSAVDALITGGEQEFNSRFIVAEFPDTSDTIIKIVKKLFELYGPSYKTINDIPDSNILVIATEFNYQNNYKPETKVKKLREAGSDYYELLFLAEGKTILSNEVYADVLRCVQAFKESPATEYFFRPDDPFNNDIERLYQLKFKATLNGIDYRCMADLIIVDYAHKIIYPKDVKTSSHYEYEFFKSFVQWDYQIQARLYWRIIRDNLDRDPYFKDFRLADYDFLVVNKQTLNPLVWNYPDTTVRGTILAGKNASIELPDPEDIGRELHHYLVEMPAVPDGVDLHGSNNIKRWLNTYEG